MKDRLIPSAFLVGGTAVFAGALFVGVNGDGKDLSRKDDAIQQKIHEDQLAQRAQGDTHLYAGEIVDLTAQSARIHEDPDFKEYREQRTPRRILVVGGFVSVVGVGSVATVMGDRRRRPATLGESKPQI